MDELIKAVEEMLEADVSHDRATMAMFPRKSVAKVAAALENYKREKAHGLGNNRTA